MADFTPPVSAFPSVISHKLLNNLYMLAVESIVIAATNIDPTRRPSPFPARSHLPSFEFRFSNFGFLPLSPLPATLADTPSSKSFACHSYENTGGVSLPANNLSVPSLFQISPLSTSHSPLSPLESALTKSRGVWAPPLAVQSNRYPAHFCRLLHYTPAWTLLTAT